MAHRFWACPSSGTDQDWFYRNRLCSHVRHAPDVRANIIRISISRSRCRMFPLFDLRKSGTEEAKFICNLCKNVKCRLIGHGQVVWMFHNYSLIIFCNLLKNPPHDQIYIWLIWLEVRYLTCFFNCIYSQLNPTRKKAKRARIPPESSL